MAEVVKETPGLIKTLIEVKPELGAVVLTMFVSLVLIFAFVIWIMKQQSAMYRLIIEYGRESMAAIVANTSKMEELRRNCHQEIKERHNVRE